MLLLLSMIFTSDNSRHILLVVEEEHCDRSSFFSTTICVKKFRDTNKKMHVSIEHKSVVICLEEL